MLKRSLITLACLTSLTSLTSLSLIPLTASANSDDTQDPIFGVYFGAMGGINKLDLTTGTQSRTVAPETYDFTTDKNRFAGNLHIGNLWGLDEDNTFGAGIELGATYWGNFDFNGANTTTGNMGFDQETLNILMDLQWNITQQFFIMPQFGVAFNVGNSSGDLTVNSTTAAAATRHKADPLVGLNIGFNATPSLSVYLSGERLMGDSFDQSYVNFDQRMLESTAVFIGINYDIGP